MQSVEHFRVSIWPRQEPEQGAQDTSRCPGHLERGALERRRGRGEKRVAAHTETQRVNEFAYIKHVEQCLAPNNRITVSVS